MLRGFCEGIGAGRTMHQVVQTVQEFAEKVRFVQWRDQLKM
jgi:DNA-binding transcriptional regulator LsrR (DeoR family)